MIIKGTVEEIIFRNESNGYTVFVLERADRTIDNEQFINVVGNFPVINEGALLEIEGEFKSTSKYGEQFSAKNIKFSAPDSEAGIVRYLASGLIKGVGPVLALRIVEKFGKQAPEIIEFNPTKLASVKGVSPKKAVEISEGYKAVKVVQNAVMFLGRYGITVNLALRIYNVYGEETEAIVKRNPYDLIENVDGVGFVTADRIAEKIGIAKDSEFRLRAGIVYTLSQATENGHTYYPLEALVAEAAASLAGYSDRLEAVVWTLAGMNKIKIVKIKGTDACALPAYYHYEKVVADKLVLLSGEAVTPISADSEIAEYERLNDITLHSVQRQAVDKAVNCGVSIITGGPGTGKTTIIKCIIKILASRNEKVLLVAPTGRAAKRLSETTGEDGKTIHRALESDGFSSGFNYNERNRLPFDAIIVDEVSMVDAYLMSALLKAISEGTRLILVGDSDQLPSVGAGNVLKDLITSDYFETVRLEYVYRQESDSKIIENAHLINTGEMPIFPASDFFFSSACDQNAIAEDIVTMASVRIPKYLNVSPMQIQVLSPIKSGTSGTDNLNSRLQATLNPPAKNKREIIVGKRLFREGDRVMHTANRYQMEWREVGSGGVSKSGKGIFNGEIGVILGINTETGEITVLFEESKMASYSREESLDLMLSYAITVHKSQGSEFDVVIIPVTGGNPTLLTRNLLYTGVTRAKQMVVLVGDKYSLKRMIDNNRTVERYTMLKDLLEKSSKKYNKQFPKLV